MWSRWKLVRQCGTPTKDYIGQNGIRLKCGELKKFSKGEKYEFVLLQGWAVGVLYGFDQIYGPYFEVINHQGWEVRFDE
jgi:hypothetical protein